MISILYFVVKTLLCLNVLLSVLFFTQPTERKILKTLSKTIGKIYLISWFRQKRIINYASKINGSYGKCTLIRVKLSIHLSPFDYTTISVAIQNIQLILACASFCKTNLFSSAFLPLFLLLLRCFCMKIRFKSMKRILLVYRQFKATSMPVHPCSWIGLDPAVFHLTCLLWF